MDGRRFDVVLFDLGDTLIYFDGDWSEVFAEARQAMLISLQGAGLDLGQEFIDDFYARMLDYYQQRDEEFIEYTTHYILRTALSDWGYGNTPDEVLSQALVGLHAVTQAHWHPEADALPTLQALRQMGYRLAMISNAADDPNTQVLVDKLGARPYLEFVMSSASQGIRKPNPKIFLATLEKMGTVPERSVMVGDMLGADILGAHNAGIFAIWITRRADKAANRAHADTIRPDAQVATLSELPGLMERLESEARRPS
jgi:HAD superfamily hydrolase (TIGR01509 family)